MLIILITLATTNVARTPLKFIGVDSNGGYRTFIPVLNIDFTHGIRNGYLPVPIYEYPATLEGVVNQGHDSNVHRLITQYGLGYPYGQRNKGNLIETTAAYDQFGNDRKNTNMFDYVPGLTTEKLDTVGTGNNKNDRFNGPVDDSGSNDKQAIDGSGHNNGQQITSTDTRTYQSASKVDTKVSGDNKTISEDTNNTSTDQGSINAYPSVNSTNKNTDNTEANLFKNNNTVNNDIDKGANNTQYDTKMIEDNEETSTSETNYEITEDVRSVRGEGGETVKTTTLAPLDNRAVLGGDACPTGMAKVKDKCVKED